MKGNEKERIEITRKAGIKQISETGDKKLLGRRFWTELAGRKRFHRTRFQ